MEALKGLNGLRQEIHELREEVRQVKATLVDFAEILRTSTPGHPPATLADVPKPAASMEELEDLIKNANVS